MDDVTLLLERVAEEGMPRGASAVMHGARQSLLVEPRVVPPVRSEWRARRGLLVACAVVLVAVLVTSVVVVTRDTTRPANVLPAITDTATYRDLYDTSDQPLDGLLYLVPGFVPDGLDVLRVDDPSLSSGAGSTPQWDRILGFVRLDPAGERMVESFRLSWGSGAVPDVGADPRTTPTTPAADPLARWRSQGTAVTVRGHEGVVVESPSGGDRLVIWEESPGRLVQVDSGTLGADDLIAIAEGLTGDTDVGFELTHAPDGFVQVSAEPSMFATGKGRDVVYTGADGSGFGVFVEDHSSRSPGANLLLSRAAFGDKRIVDVNGRHAVIGAHINSGVSFDQQTLFLDSAEQTVQWLAPGNTLVTLIAKGLSEDDVLAIARGLRAVDADEWEQFPSVAPTTTTTGAPPLDPPAPEPDVQSDEEQIADVFRTFIEGPDLDTMVSLLEDGEGLREFLTQEPANKDPQGGYTARVDSVTLTDDTHADVSYSIVSKGQVVLPNQRGGAVKVDGTWKMSRDGYCALVAQGGLTCPSR